jgi:hypothetical protein
MTSLQLGTKKIDSVWLIDDDPQVRATYGYPVEDLKLKAVNQDGPLGDLDTFTKTFSADAAICDHHLTPNNYARFKGAELVARWYDMQYPAILCTKVENALDEIRPYLRRIPVLFKETGELNPDSVRFGFEKCIAEFNGKFSQTRREWRALVRIVDLDMVSTNRTVYVVIPAWDSKREIRLQFSELPKNIQEVVAASKRFHAFVNIGAESHEDLYFEKWEVE